MMPCRIFLQKMQLYPEPLNSPKPKISLLLNSIYYDEIKPFNTKYFCLTMNDCIQIQAVMDDKNNQCMVGRAQIKNAYKIAAECQTIDITITGNNNRNSVKQIRLWFLLQPVAALKRNKLMMDTQNNIKFKLNNAQNTLPDFPYQFRPQTPPNQLEISFSHREPKDRDRDPLMETNSLFNMTKDYLPFKYSYKDIPLFNDTIKSQTEEAQSLESLAHQREKILGELFGRFKK